MSCGRRTRTDRAWRGWASRHAATTGARGATTSARSGGPRCWCVGSSLAESCPLIVCSRCMHCLDRRASHRKSSNSCALCRRGVCSKWVQTPAQASMQQRWLLAVKATTAAMRATRPCSGAFSPALAAATAAAARMPALPCELLVRVRVGLNLLPLPLPLLLVHQCCRTTGIGGDVQAVD